MSNPVFIPGQKWISTAEPELGLGRVMAADARQVQCFYDLAGEQRVYASRQAPLVRVQFGEGDILRTLDGIEITVHHTREKDGILVYHGTYNGTETAVMETEIDPAVTFSQPQERLLTGQLDHPDWYLLRHDTLIAEAQFALDPQRGLRGPRVALVPHQLYIASEVAARYAPRVLLADEVGLGKTIEAGLIMHQQLQTGRAQRVLVVVPAALTFQWFVEMIRRFSLQFIVMDEQRAQQIEADNAPESLDTDEILLDNPFDAQQLVLTTLDLFVDHPERLAQACEADWDLVIVDEAHHLTWTPQAASPEYAAVEQLSRSAAGLLLLTATPEQLGQDAHFARLRLLDPDRFHDLEAFHQESVAFADIAGDVQALRDGDSRERQRARQAIQARLASSSDDDDALIRQLLDRHGTGRVLFRNVRGNIQGFPSRKVYPVPLPGPAGYGNDALFPETDVHDWLEQDPRVPWLIERLRGSDDKHLIICAQQQTAIHLEQYLAARTTIRTSVFHEGMDLVARDRAANYFAETHYGAQALICSEIGSEGRNFQFASHLVLFDIPANPDLVEQRIGRLDRIGQGDEIHLHIPYVEGSLQARYFRWFHEGMDLFSRPNPAAAWVFARLGERINLANIDSLIDDTRELNSNQLKHLEAGRDRLIEFNSNQPKEAQAIAAALGDETLAKTLEAYMEQSFTLFGLESEPLDDALFVVKPTEQNVRNVSVSAETLEHYHYPELPEEGVRYSYHRAAALARDDVGFFTWEHPLVRQAIDHVLSDVTGNSTMVAVRHPGLKAGTLLVETLHVANCQVAGFDVTRYLPPTLMRALLTPDLQDLSERLSVREFSEPLDIPTQTLASIVESQKQGIRSMLAHANTLAGQQMTQLVAEASARAEQQLGGELERLTALQAVNPNVRSAEIDYFKKAIDTLQHALAHQATPRLEAVRVIVAA